MTAAARRDRLATALRQFGLVDRFGLAEIVAAEALPTEAAVARRLACFPNALPASVTAATLARYIMDELEHGGDPANCIAAAPVLSAADGQALSDIPAGTKSAGRYHSQIVRILSGVFAGRLVEPRKEREQFQGRRRIDLVFRNVDRAGFFAELQQRHDIKAPYVLVECKNYSNDPGNPEFAQLSERLNDYVGRFGLMVVRQVTDRQRLDAHRRDRRGKSEWLVVLDDEDILAMLSAHVRNNRADVDAVLLSRFEPLLFD